jgi:hypothetical protein
MTTVRPDPRRTYVDFRRQIRRFIAEAQAQGHDEAGLHGALRDALKGWLSQGYPKSWVFQARADALKSLTRAARSARPPLQGNVPDRLVLAHPLDAGLAEEPVSRPAPERTLYDPPRPGLGQAGQQVGGVRLGETGAALGSEDRPPGFSAPSR